MTRGREPVGGCGNNHCSVGGKRSALELPRPVAKAARSSGGPGAGGAAGVPCRADCAVVGGNRYVKGKEADCGYDADDEVRSMTQDKAWDAIKPHPARLTAKLLQLSSAAEQRENWGTGGDAALSAHSGQKTISCCFRPVNLMDIDTTTMSRDELTFYFFARVKLEQQQGPWKHASWRRQVRERARQLGVGIYG